MNTTKKHLERPKRSRKTITDPRLTMRENLTKLVFGTGDGKDGTFWAHDLWLHANPSPAVRDQGERAGLDPDYAAETRDEINRETGNAFGEEAFRRVKAGDWKFFAEMAYMVKRIISEPSRARKRQTEMLAYTTTQKPRLYTTREMVEYLSTKAFAGDPAAADALSDDGVRRDMRNHGVPRDMRDGRPRGSQNVLRSRSGVRDRALPAIPVIVEQHKKTHPWRRGLSAGKTREK